MNLFKNVNPAGALADFATVFRQAGANRWRIAVLAALTTAGVFSTLFWESWKKPRDLPQITYITSWPASRTEAETRAFIRENQARKEEREALQAAQAEQGRQLWKTVGRMSGLDVEKMDRDGRAERAAEAAAERDRIARLSGQQPGGSPIGR